MLNYEEFKEKVKNEIKDHMDGKYANAEPLIKETTKTNRVVDGLVLLNLEGMGNASPTIYLNGMYESYLVDGDFEKIISQAAKTIEHGIGEFQKTMPSNALDTDRILDNVFFALVNAEQNQEMLENVPHRTFEDLAVVYRWHIAGENDAMFTNLINNALAEREGFTEEQLYEAASKNTKEMFPVTIRNMNEVIADMLFKDGLLEEPMQEEFSEMMAEVPDERSMYVISNSRNMFGAASILYEEELHNLAEKFGTDLYILPSSVHECIAISSNGASPEELAEMVYEINMEQVEIDDRLSNQVYHYDKDLRTLRLATDTPNKSLDDKDLAPVETAERKI